MADSTNPVLDVAKKSRESDIYTLPDGTQVRVVPVSAALIDEVTRRIKDPDVPVIHDEESGKDLANPGDPKYLQARAEMIGARSRATVDALAMFGLDLIEGLPKDGEWLKKLKYLERLGHLDLGKFDMNDPVDVEFLYKRFIACSGDVIEKITRASGVSGEEIEVAEASFQRPEVG